MIQVAQFSDDYSISDIVSWGKNFAQKAFAGGLVIKLKQPRFQTPGLKLF